MQNVDHVDATAAVLYSEQVAAEIAVVEARSR